MAYKAEIPYGAYWSTPFARWQGDGRMYAFLLVLGAVITAAGLALVASGVSVQDHAFDATNVLLKAVDACKTTSKAINDYLSTVSYPGLTKTLKFDSKGEVSSATIYVYEVKSGTVTFDGSVDQLIAGG